MSMQVGLDHLEANSPLARFLNAHRVGVLAHPASVDRHLDHIQTKLARAGIRPIVYFGPEHGFGGEAQDMIGVTDARTPDGVPIRSLYGEEFSALTPTDEDMKSIDVVLVDLADVGSRYYTFVWTAVLARRAATKHRKITLILDRPNPLGHELVEGKLLEEKYKSFVGLESIPIRHALTVGEIAAWCAKNERVDDALLKIIPSTIANSKSNAHEWDRPFVTTSPNMPTYETALVYPGGCLLEGTNLSEGRGTTRPFEWIGAPWLDGAKLASALSALNLPGFVARPITFLPQFQKHAKAVCGGVQIHVQNTSTFRPVATYAALITLAHHHHPNEFRFRTERYEFRDDVPALDLLAGSPEMRTQILANAPAIDIAESLSAITHRERDVVAAARDALNTYKIGSDRI